MTVSIISGKLHVKNLKFSKKSSTFRKKQYRKIEEKIDKILCTFNLEKSSKYGIIITSKITSIKQPPRWLKIRNGGFYMEFLEIRTKSDVPNESEYYNNYTTCED